MATDGAGRIWGIVLAAGEGRRLASLTTALYGRALPKQFAVLAGQRSLLQETMARIAPIAPPQRTVVVVAEDHAALAREQLRGYPGVDLVAQPRNLDTGPGILLPLARVLARDPEATVAVFPSDHHIRRPGPFRKAVARALLAISDDGIVLLGAAPDHAETEYGWIVPGRPLGGGLRRVERFVEKPHPATASALLKTGALWNTFVQVGRARAFRGLAERHMPLHANLFEQYGQTIGRAGEQDLLREIYGAMPAANFSRAVLERAGSLAVLPLERSGWCDWGSPERVMRSLHGTSGLHSLEQRLAVGAAGALAAR